MLPLTADQAVILASTSQSWAAGLEVLNADLTVKVDISDDLESGSVARNMNASPHGSCDLTVARELNWPVDLVRPYMTGTDDFTGLSARWNRGVYTLKWPERQVGQTPETYEVQGLDRLRLLDREVADDYTVAAGVTYRAALVQVFADAGLTGYLIEGAAADNTLPLAKTWPLIAETTDPNETDQPVTWKRIVNDLQKAWRGRGVWADENGLFRLQEYQRPTDRPVEFTFDADSIATLVAEERTQTLNMDEVPNYWKAIATNPPGGVTPSTGNGLIQVRENTDAGPTSQTARGLTYKKVLKYEAANATVLSDLIDDRVAHDLRGATKLAVRTSPFPAAWHSDVYLYADLAFGSVARRVQSVEWRHDLTGGDCDHLWEVV